MSKIFEAVGNSPRKLEVESEGDGKFSLWVVDHKGKCHMIFLSSDTAPALALAEMEAAGYLEGDFVNAPDTMEWFGKAMLYLRYGIEAQEREQAKATAEAKERAELEAEAYEFYKVASVALGDDTKGSFNELIQDGQSMWLAVAKKARELAGK